MQIGWHRSFRSATRRSNPCTKPKKKSVDYAVNWNQENNIRINERHMHCMYNKYNTL